MAIPCKSLEFIKEDIDVPVRDGLHLKTTVFRPDDNLKHPLILHRTPYGRRKGGDDLFAVRLVRSGYVFASQDMRGRYDSEGEFTPLLAIDQHDGKDGYDSIEWFAKQNYCNGNIGTFGGSNSALAQWNLARLRPPHLKAMMAYTIPREITALDYPGTFRLGRRLHWLFTSIAPDIRRRAGMSKPHTSEEARESWAKEQHRFLEVLPVAKLADYLPEQLGNQFLEWLKNPAVKLWKLDQAYKDIEVPNLDISGWFDHCSDTMRHLEGMRKSAETEAARTQSKLIVGPWSHGTVNTNGGVGKFDFGPSANLDLGDLVIRWFDCWLKRIDNGIKQEPAVRYFVMGANRWKSAPEWPPRPAKLSEFYLSSGELSPEQAIGKEYDEYEYDPVNPVPTLWKDNLITVPSDRNELKHRKDILYYVTAPLEKDIEIAGYPKVVLYASSSAPDTDFYARLVLNNPEKGALEIAYGMVRARHRNSLEKEEFITPGEVTEFNIELGPVACRFGKGCRIRLEITSSDFPNFDRNHNTGKNDLFDSELQTAQQKIFHSEKFPSCLILPVQDIK